MEGRFAGERGLDRMRNQWLATNLPNILARDTF